MVHLFFIVKMELLYSKQEIFAILNTQNIFDTGSEW